MENIETSKEETHIRIFVFKFLVMRHLAATSFVRAKPKLVMAIPKEINAVRIFAIAKISHFNAQKLVPAKPNLVIVIPMEHNAVQMLALAPKPKGSFGQNLAAMYNHQYQNHPAISMSTAKAKAALLIARSL